MTAVVGARRSGAAERFSMGSFWIAENQGF